MKEAGEYTALITPHIKDNRYIKIGPPAAPEAIAEAERAAGRPLPAELRRVLEELDGDRWLLFSAEQIAQTNEQMRGYGEIYDGIERFIFFAGNGCGDYYCYAFAEKGLEDGIFIWEHETNETRRVASDIEELIRRYYDSEI